MSYNTDHLLTVGHAKVLYDDVKSKLTSGKGKALIPTYIGDFMSYSEGLQSMCIVDGLVYTINQPGEAIMMEEQSDDCILRVFDIANNVELTDMSKTVTTGHSNSLCYDYENHKFYVAHEWTYVNGTKADAVWIDEFDEDFEFIQKITTPTLPQAVTYDPVQNVLYYLGWHGTLYKRTESGWDAYCTFDLSEVYPTIRSTGHGMNQDFAVYDGRFYWTHQNNQFISGLLTQPVSIVDSSFVFQRMDAECRFNLGELQGMEFTPDGHLFAACGLETTAAVYDNFILELPVGVTIPYMSNMGGNLTSLRQHTVTLSDESVSEFALAASHIRSLSQLYAMPQNRMVVNVEIPAGSDVVEDGTVMISQDLTISVSGRYTCKSISIRAGHVVFYPLVEKDPDEAHIVLTAGSDTYPISFAGPGRVTFGGDEIMRFSLPNQSNGNSFMYGGRYYPVEIHGYPPRCIEGYTLYICGTAATSFQDLRVGGTRYPQEVTTLTRHYATNSYVAEAGFNCVAVYQRPYTAGSLVIDFTLADVLPVNTDVKIGEFEALRGLNIECVNNVSGEIGAPMTVSVDRNAGITIRTSGTTYAGDRYRATVACIWADDNW